MAKNPSSKRYALALYQLASENKSVEKCKLGLELCRDILDDSRITAFLGMPNIRVEKKIDLITTNLGEVDRLVVNLMGMLIQRDTTSLVADILNQYNKILDQESGLQRAHAVSAVVMTKQSQSRLSKFVSEVVGKDIELTTEVNSEMTAGLVARVGDKILDGSVKTRLRDLRKSLAEGAS